MTASVVFLKILITASTIIVTIAPIALVVLWVRDARRGDLW